MKESFPLLSAFMVSFLRAGICMLTSCASTDPFIVPQERLAPDAVASVDFSPSRLKRVGVLPFMEGEGPPWEEVFQAGPAAVDAAERFSAAISWIDGLEVVPPDRIASLFPRDAFEVITRKQVMELCRKLGLDAIFRGRLGMIAERASADWGEVIIPFAFVTLEVELLDAGSGEMVWFASHHLNSFQFIRKEVRINVSKPAAAERRLTEDIPGYPDTDKTLTILAELVIAEVAESFSRSCSEAGRR